MKKFKPLAILTIVIGILLVRYQFISHGLDSLGSAAVLALLGFAWFILLVVSIFWFLPGEKK